MFIPLIVDLYYNNNDWKVFFSCIMVTAFVGGILVLTNAHEDIQMNSRRQGFLMITFSWLVLCIFSALPFWFSETNTSFTDALFESTSGLTTTGSTIFTDIESLPEGILIWRAMLQWLGGIGVILMAMSILPMLKVGGMQLFETELSEREKVLPRTAKLASSIGAIYMALTLLCAFLYNLAGMNLFDSFAHAMTTISTGGYSTYDSSFGHFDAIAPEFIAIVFMIGGGGIPFVLYLKFVNGNPKALLKDTQVRWFLSVVAISTLTLFFYVLRITDLPEGEAMRHAVFNVVSLVTGTGYTSTDYGLWGMFAISLLFFLMVVGGSAGSTTCGIKIFRFQVLFSVADTQIKKLIHPHGVFIPRYNNKPIDDDIPIAVMSFFFLYALCFAVLAIALSFIGLDFLTAMSGAATTISNVGPGLGNIIGPAGTFDPLPDSAKWVLSIGMLLGRLELFTVLVMFSPHFWRR